MIMTGTMRYHILKYSSIFIVMVLQEDDPFNFVMTCLPIIGYLFITIALRLTEKEKINISYDKKYLATCLMFILLGGHFFIIGMD